MKNLYLVDFSFFSDVMDSSSKMHAETVFAGLYIFYIFNSCCYLTLGHISCCKLKKLEFFFVSMKFKNSGLVVLNLLS